MSDLSQDWHGRAQFLSAVLWVFSAIVLATLWTHPGFTLKQDRLAVSAASESASEERKRRSRGLLRYAAQLTEVEFAATKSVRRADANGSAPAAILPAFAVAEISAWPGVVRSAPTTGSVLACAQMFQARAPPALIA